jgi:hypothetical protein
MASPVLKEPAPENVLALENGDMLYTSPILKIELLPIEMTWTTPTIAGMDYTLFHHSSFYRMYMGSICEQFARFLLRCSNGCFFRYNENLLMKRKGDG